MTAAEPGSPPIVVERNEILLPGPAAALAGLLDVADPGLEAGGRLPMLWHWLYTLDRPPRKDLGTDGHPVRGALPAPPEPGRRRMWAGGRVTTHAPLHAHVPVRRHTRLLAEVTKEGRTGTLTFATVLHEISQDDRVAVREEQDIVYRAAPTAPTADGRPPGDPEPPLPVAADEWAIDVDPVLLFRYSALTYNGHRIHYDRDYARDVEGYPGLVTHGPLQAVCMAEAARRGGIDASVGYHLEYRLLAPLFDHQGFVVRCAPASNGADLSVRDRWGRQTAAGVLDRL